MGHTRETLATLMVRCSSMRDSAADSRCGAPRTSGWGWSSPGALRCWAGLAGSIVGLFATPSAARAEVKNVAELVAAVTGGLAGDVVVVGPGTFELTESLRPKPGMEIRGAGIGVTIIRNAASWAPGDAGLDKDEGVTKEAIDCSKYLFDLGSNSDGITVSDMTLTGPPLHGGLCGFVLGELELTRTELKSFLWAGLRIYIMNGAKLHDNVFFDAGGKSMGDSGSSGGALFLTYTVNAEIYENRFDRSDGNDGYGVKGRELRSSRIHHNTIDTNFAIEFPHDNDYFVEIDHNYLGGVLSIPKYAGGTFPEGGYTFHVHHNYFNTSYAIEYHRNGIEIDHNLFDFSTAADGGNLISGFGEAAAVGSTRMHDNLVSNPGRGLYWNEGVYDDFAFYNNHVKGETTVTPRTEGLFAFRPERDGVVTDWSKIVVRDNIFDLSGTLRPLMRNDEGHAAVIENNTLTGISDARAYANPTTDQPRGPLEPLCFRLGADEEWTLDGWSLAKTPDPAPAGDCGEEASSSSSEGGSSESGERGTTGDGGPTSGDLPTGSDGGEGTTTTSGGEGTSDGPGPGGDTIGGWTSTGATSEGATGADATPEAGGCACASDPRGPGGLGWAGLTGALGLLLSTRRRRCASSPRLSAPRTRSSP